MHSTEYKKHGELVRERILSAIKLYTMKHGYAPSFEEIGKMVGLKSKSTVYNHMLRLFDEGKLEKDTEYLKPRAYRVSREFNKLTEDEAKELLGIAFVETEEEGE